MEDSPLIHFLEVRQTHLCVLLVSLAKHIAAHGVQRTTPVAAFGAPVKLNLVMERQSTRLSRCSQASFLRWLVFLQAIAFGAQQNSVTMRAILFMSI